MGGDVWLWDEFSPVLYDLSVAVSCDAYRDQRQVSFGMRQVDR